LATRLHEKDPETFGDSNHKPEIAVALGEFESFVGFMPLSEVKELFTSIPTLARFVNWWEQESTMRL
jgi:mannose-6-phosphate isomerase